MPAKTKGNPVEATVQDLLQHPEQFTGKTITTSGYFMGCVVHSDDEQIGLWISPGPAPPGIKLRGFHPHGSVDVVYAIINRRSGAYETAWSALIGSRSDTLQFVITGTADWRTQEGSDSPGAVITVSAIKTKEPTN